MERPNEDLGGMPRTMEGDEAHYTAFLLGTPSLQAANCSMQRILKLPRAWVVLYILHSAMAMGRLLGEFVDREARGVTPLLREVCRLERLRLSFLERGRNGKFFFRQYKAIANLWDLLQALYCIFLCLPRAQRNQRFFARQK